MTLHNIRFVSGMFLALMLTTSLLCNDNYVVAFQPSPKIHHPYMMSSTPQPTTTVSEASSKTAPITMILSAWLLSTTMMVVSLPSPVLAQSAPDITKGQVLFQANCAGCHAGGNNYVQEKRTLRQADIQQYRGSTDQAVIANFVQNGMPHKLFPMKAPMEEKDYNDVVAYVLDQALGEKW
jgi:cytochrome c6